MSWEWLRPTPFVDSDAPAVVEFARKAVGDEIDSRLRAIALYYAVRDGITYTSYSDFPSPAPYRPRRARRRAGRRYHRHVRPRVPAAGRERTGAGDAVPRRGRPRRELSSKRNLWSPKTCLGGIS